MYHRPVEGLGVTLGSCAGRCTASSPASWRSLRWCRRPSCCMSPCSSSAPRTCGPFLSSGPSRTCWLCAQLTPAAAVPACLVTAPMGPVGLLHAAPVRAPEGRCCQQVPFRVAMFIFPLAGLVRPRLGCASALPTGPSHTQLLLPVHKCRSSKCTVTAERRAPLMRAWCADPAVHLLREASPELGAPGSLGERPCLRPGLSEQPIARSPTTCMPISSMPGPGCAAHVWLLCGPAPAHRSSWAVCSRRLRASPSAWEWPAPCTPPWWSWRCAWVLDPLLVRTPPSLPNTKTQHAGLPCSRGYFRACLSGTARGPLVHAGRQLSTQHTTSRAASDHVHTWHTMHLSGVHHVPGCS